MTHVPTRASESQIPQLVEVYANAFIDDPLIRWPLRADISLPECSAMFQTLLELYDALGVVWQVEECSGSAAWLDPSVAAHFAEIDHAMLRQVAPLTDDGGVLYGRFGDWLGSQVPEEPCWFLDMVAVHPKQRGRGLGRVLVEQGLALARADGLPAFLETSHVRNVGYYEGFGFEVIGQERAPGGGPEIWFMRHPGK